MRMIGVEVKMWKRISRAFQYKKWVIFVFPLLLASPKFVIDLAEGDSFVMPAFLIIYVTGVACVVLYYASADTYSNEKKD